MNQPKLERYVVFVKLTVLGETPDDAIDYVTEALDHSDLLDQDGIVGIELVDDADSIEPMGDEDVYNDESDD